VKIPQNIGSSIKISLNQKMRNKGHSSLIDMSMINHKTPIISRIMSDLDSRWNTGEGMRRRNRDELGYLVPMKIGNWYSKLQSGHLVSDISP
jgi:hypothetical protein